MVIERQARQALRLADLGYASWLLGYCDVDVLAEISKQTTMSILTTMTIKTVVIAFDHTSTTPIDSGRPYRQPNTRDSNNQVY